MRRTSLILAVLVVTSACYHAVIETGRPAGSTVINRAWAHGFIFGLVPPSVTNVAQQCPSGVSKVETKHSFLNGLVGGLTWSLYTPMQITVTCAQGEEENATPALTAARHEAAHAIDSAVRLSAIDGKPVYIGLR